MYYLKRCLKMFSSVTSSNNRTRRPGSSTIKCFSLYFQVLRYNKMKVNTEIHLEYILNHYHSHFGGKWYIWIHTYVFMYPHLGVSLLWISWQSLQFSGKNTDFGAKWASIWIWTISIYVSCTLKTFALDDKLYVILNILYYVIPKIFCKISDKVICHLEVLNKSSHYLTNTDASQLSQHIRKAPVSLSREL